MLGGEGAGILQLGNLGLGKICWLAACLSIGLLWLGGLFHIGLKIIQEGQIGEFAAPLLAGDFH